MDLRVRKESKGTGVRVRWEKWEKRQDNVILTFEDARTLPERGRESKVFEQ